MHRRGQAAQRVRPRAAWRPRKHLQQPAGELLPRASRPANAAEAAAQVFLGVRLQCARCHNHPFEHWTQNDYHSLSAFFARVDYHIVENNRRDRFDKHEFDGEQIVYGPRGRGDAPAHRRSDAAALPRQHHADAGRRPTLAGAGELGRAPDNPFFARAQVNRVWHHLMGRGIVDPDDDFRASNPPVNGPLLEALAKDFADHHFDLRHLVRTIMNSRTYQLSAVPNETNRDDETNFSHALVRPLQAEQLLDALAQVTAVPVKFNGYPLGTRAVRAGGGARSRATRPASDDGEQFLRRFGKPERLLSCECERSDDTTLEQAFQLLTGGVVNQLLSAPDNRIGRLLARGKTDREIIEEFYLAALSRFPMPQELSIACSSVERAKDRRAALEDLVAGLVSAKEFLLRARPPRSNPLGRDGSWRAR